jgi:hypothetical protein
MQFVVRGPAALLAAGRRRASSRTNSGTPTRFPKAGRRIQLRKVEADLSLDKEMLQAVIRRKL